MRQACAWTVMAVGLAIGTGLQAAPSDGKPADPKAVATAAENQADYQALQMFRKASALMDDRQDERAVKLLAALPLNFPKSGIRFKASLALGKYYAGKNEFQLALKNLTPVADAEDAEPEMKAEALYRIGTCYFGMQDYSRALTTLRKVTEQYPWNVSANEAYYYIGLCHFKQNRWSKAIEALKLVGTSVPPSAKTQNLIESGQRFFVKVNDKDLRVLAATGGMLSVQIRADSGDTEPLATTIFDLEGEIHLGSIKMELGAPKPNDGKLQIRGGDVLHVEYLDGNTQDGGLKVKRLSSSRAVSTATVGFMDGAFREYVHGVIAGQNTFIRVKDFDADLTDQKDRVKIRLYSQYRVQKTEEQLEKEAISLEAGAEFALRDELTLELVETEAHSGLFNGALVVEAVAPGVVGDKKDAKLVATEKDAVLMEYVDKDHIDALESPRTASARAEFLTGQIQDVWIAHREVSTEDLRARKNLLEAQFYLKLAQIFKDVGLIERAVQKADTGLEKVDDILRRSVKVSIDRSLIEEAYKAKWDLLLAKGDLEGAVTACRTLVALFPRSSLADVALLQVAKAQLEAKKTPEALRVLSGVLGMKGSSTETKAEAQFLIGSILEKTANDRPTKEEQLKAMGQAIDAFRTCADQYPESPFAGQSLGKVVDFYVDSKEYDRSLEMLQTIFVDFPDASFLDEMLLKWGVVLAQTKRYDEAREKLQQLQNEYPNSPASGKAQKIMEVVNRRAGSSS